MKVYMYSSYKLLLLLLILSGHEAAPSYFSPCPSHRHLAQSSWVVCWTAVIGRPLGWLLVQFMTHEPWRNYVTVAERLPHPADTARAVHWQKISPLAPRRRRHIA